MHFDTTHLDSTIQAMAFLLLPLLTFGCASGGATSQAKPYEAPSLLGEVSREQIEAAEPSWVSALVESESDMDAALALADTPAEAHIDIYLGTWCGDSKRELARFWQALDTTGGLVPFEVRYIAVDRYDYRPPELERDHDLRYVPTFIVRRKGEEVGRVVEVSPNGIEKDILSLLTGTTSGVISDREDLGGKGSSAH